MKNLPLFLRATAALVFAAGVFLWISAGANRGWSRQQVPVEITDQQTGAIRIEFENRWVPGIDFVAGSALLAGLVFALSFAAGKRQSRLHPQP